MKELMNRAWEIAKEGQERFGGKVSEYLSESLKMAWAEYKQEDKMTMEDIAKAIENKVNSVQVNIWEKYGKRRIYVNKGFKNCVAMLEFDDQDNYIGRKIDGMDLFGARQAGWEDELEAVKEIIEEVA